MKWFKRKKDIKVLFPQTDCVVEEAFEVGGVMYYRFADISNLEYRRGLMAYTVYNELDMRCTREYLLKHVVAMTNLLSGSEIDIYKIKALNDQMRQRMELTTDVDLMYKLASVIYFDKNENPASYDTDYCEKKIAHWKEHKGVADFFLTQPLTELMPFLHSVDTDLDSYSILNHRLNEVHSELLRMLSSKKE